MPATIAEAPPRGKAARWRRVAPLEADSGRRAPPAGEPGEARPVPAIRSEAVAPKFEIQARPLACPRQTTRSGGGLPAKKASAFCTTRMPMATRVSSVALPRCGSNTTFSIRTRSGVTFGSPS